MVAVPSGGHDPGTTPCALHARKNRLANAALVCLSCVVLAFAELLLRLRYAEATRTPFQQHPDPASLYYRIDGHWNKTGIRFAARAILNVIQRDKESAANLSAATKRQADGS